ncbi:MAG: peptidyl-prolyl cis-trans isomerase [Gammaproteobacteria bacterium]|nr:peptidyl-prolyl cis-trans isomerase [Gammaproteobacteria bacterium]
MSQQVKLETSAGEILIELDAEKAPLSAQNFIDYVKAGHYDNTVFHRVIRGFMIQGGGFDQNMDRKPTHEPIKNEAKNGLKNDRGTIAMARTNDPHSATAQFFINHVDNDKLNYPSFDGWGYAVFGRVTRGMETVDTIADTFTTSRGGMKNVPEEPVFIEKVTRISTP